MKIKKILLNILTHADELVGKSVAEEISRRYPHIINNGLDIQIANKKAYEQNKKFITHDLNRVFPGKPKGSYEEKRAHELVPIISSYDLVIDIHSTESGSGDMVIITKINKDTKKILKYLSPKYVLFMNTGPDKSLISSARLGIAFEMGSDKDKKTIKKTIKGIESLLNYANLIKKPRTFGFKTKAFEVLKQVPKPTKAKLKSKIKNFKLIKSGEIYAETTKGTPIIAQEDFYPVIFGNTNYETIFGFASKPLTLN